MYIVPPNLFVEQKFLILTEILFCDRNENKSKELIRKFHEFTNNKFKISIKWITRFIKFIKEIAYPTATILVRRNLM